MVERNVIDRGVIPDAVRKYADYLQPKINVLGIFLFGSHIKGTARDDSDIDIAVISDSFTGDPVEDLATLLLFKNEIDNRIEPHPFLPDDFTIENPFAREIMESSIRIA
jgi:predicted nucleotidyltransferase